MEASFNEENFYKKSFSFLDNLFYYLEKKSILVDQLELDHICYRVETLKSYNEMFNFLTKIGRLLIEAPISGRKIATFKLHNPIVYNDRKVFLIELPAPKKGFFYKEGFEHGEFVLIESFDSFQKKYSDIDFNFTKKNINSDLSLKLSSDLAVKFHQQSLEDVIAFEKRQILT